MPYGVIFLNDDSSFASINRVCNCGNAIRPTGIVRHNNVVSNNHPFDQKSGKSKKPVNPILLENPIILFSDDANAEVNKST